MKSILVLALIALTLSSCVSVQEYDKVNLSDPEMELAAKKIERFETNFQLYREGSSGANGGKTGGGCGCN
jgi:PBP1b-binding outer membrane lipoprotein LpoB